MAQWIEQCLGPKFDNENDVDVTQIIRIDEKNRLVKINFFLFHWVRHSI